ncbi:MAG: PhoH family protein [Burkholderiaceae bacterium]
MPLPKAPAKPATILDPKNAVLARKSTRRPRAEDAGTTQATATATAGEPERPPPTHPSAIATATRPRPSADVDRTASSTGRKNRTPRPPLKPQTRPASVATASERRRLFVLDTNVLKHDPSSLFRFAEHDLFLPMVTLEELDAHKRGVSEVARNVRHVSRAIDDLIATSGNVIADGIALDATGNRDARGRLFFETSTIGASPESLAAGKADNQILGVVAALRTMHPERDVVLVSKDINMRIKAHALGLTAEDYFSDQVVEDTDHLYSGIFELPDDFWDGHGKGVASWQQDGSTFYRLSGPLIAAFHVNQFVAFEGELPLHAQVRGVTAREAILQTIRDFSQLRNAVWGVTARNREQNFALNLLTDPEVDFVTLVGQAGTGKTLLALAAGLAQTLESKRYSEIVVTRATVPVGDDIGYLPGTEEEKMQPWMGALEDNLEVLNQSESGAGEWGRGATSDLIRSRIRVKALSFMRGRTFVNKYLIIDEAQNLTPKQMKTLITRAGSGTKVVCLGNIAQIDTPYLTEGSSGLTYVVDRFRGWKHGGHVILQRGERSRLADFASDTL